MGISRRCIFGLRGARSPPSRGHRCGLLPDPGNDAERAQLVRRLGGKLVPKKKGRKENGDSVEAEKVEAEGGILWSGHESSPDLAWFRDRICAAYGGRAPRVWTRSPAVARSRWRRCASAAKSWPMI